MFNFPFPPGGMPGGMPLEIKDLKVMILYMIL